MDPEIGSTIFFHSETYISVDVEAAGPYPGEYALLSIGACTVDRPQSTFYVELKPDVLNITPESLAVHQLSLDKLRQTGLEPAEALRDFEAWLVEVTPPAHRPIFVAFNAAFDWMFVNAYFHKYLGRNPFGHAALDIKALYMGFQRTTWAETSMRLISERYLPQSPLTHHALEDALRQCELFEKILTDISRKN